jgi:tRNA-splicing ligase RtcB
MEQVTSKLFSWASLIEENTLEQAKRTSRLPFIYPHMALMPDAHLGLGATVGSVIPTEGAIIPAAVGVDIGCGMVAVQTGWMLDDLPNRPGRYQPGRKNLGDLRRQIELLIPLSAGQYNSILHEDAAGHITQLEEDAEKRGLKVDQHARNWRNQLGSLGSGNHFIEICTDEAGRIWLFLHSGSRGVGNRMAQQHIQVARRLAERYWIPLEDPDLAYLVEGTPEFGAYMDALMWAQDFARRNREVMMSRVIESMEWFMDDSLQVFNRIDCHHNYTARERHFGRDLWISRKGAINAQKGQAGLIPGSMGAASYVVRGLGSRLALNTAPHGAGRLLSRTQARKTFTMEDLTEQMGDREWRMTDAFLDEHPNAYKPIDVIMADAADLVEIEHKLTQIVNVKGD